MKCRVDLQEQISHTSTGRWFFELQNISLRLAKCSQSWAKRMLERAREHTLPRFFRIW